MAGRKSMLFTKLRMQSYIISSIIDNAIKFDAKVRGSKITTIDTLRADALVKKMVSLSAELYKTKGSIDNRLIDSLLNRDEEVTKKLSSLVNAESSLVNADGYTFKDVNNFVYYLAWFACTDAEPKYDTLDKYIESFAA